jgi:DNA-binding transcriptional regulator YiaG
MGILMQGELCLYALGAAQRSHYENRMETSVLAANIRALRKSRGETQIRFAEIVESDQTNVSRWERGVEPSGISLAIMAELARCSVQAFYAC